MSQPPLSPSSLPTILLIERHPLLRSTLSDWLSQEFAHCPIVVHSSLDLAEPALRKISPIVVLVGIDPRQGEGLATLRTLRRLLANTAIVALTLHPPGFLHEQALESGASACACIALSDGRLQEILHAHVPSLTGHTP